MDPSTTIRAISALALSRLLGEWRAGPGPLYERLGRTLARLVADGRLAVGTRLPAERNLAAELGVSRNTATRAYAWLREQGMLVSRQGSGSVTALGAGRALGRAPWSAAAPPPPAGELVDLTVASSPPHPEVPAALARAIDRSPGWMDDHGYHPLGLPALREAVAARFTARGLPTRPRQVLVTAGAQQALDLVARLLVRRGDVVVVESPTYAGGLDALRLAGARLVSFDVAHQGWQPARIVELCAQTHARLAYLVPEFQNPTGRLMTGEQRDQLMAGLRRHPVTVLADESLVDVALEDGAREAPLSAPEGAATVISVGSLSKPLWGGLRVGWLRAPERLVEALGRLRATADLGGPVLEQSAAVELVERLDELVAQRRDALRAQRDLLVGRLRDELGWEVAAPPGGLSLWAELPAGSASALGEAAPRFGVLLAAGPRMSADGALDRYVRVPFGLSAATLDDAVRRLEAAQRHVLRAPRADLAPLV